MKTTAVRLYGKEDLRLETFELPAIKEDEILARIVSDSICMSSFKAAEQGAAHKRVPDNVAENPIIIGHEFCGELVEVGAKWQSQFKVGDKGKHVGNLIENVISNEAAAMPRLESTESNSTEKAS